MPVPSECCTLTDLDENGAKVEGKVASRCFVSDSMLLIEQVAVVLDAAGLTLLIKIMFRGTHATVACVECFLQIFIIGMSVSVSLATLRTSVFLICN